MSNLFSIYKRELKAYFVSPVAYVVLVIFLVLAGYFFTVIVRDFAQRSLTMQAYAQAGLEMNITEWLEGFFANIAAFILFMLPPLSMRLFSEEKRQGTAELLFTYPIRDWETVLGKYFACLTVFVLMLAASAVNILIVVKYGDPEFGPIFSSYLGLLLMGAAFLAVGMFISSLTENQIIAAVATFGTLLLMWVLHWLARAAGPKLGGFMEEMSVLRHYYRTFSKGIIEVQDVTYYILVGIFFLFLTLKALESKKWRG